MKLLQYKWFYFSLYQGKLNNINQTLAPFNIFSSTALHIMQQESRSMKK